MYSKLLAVAVLALLPGFAPLAAAADSGRQENGEVLVAHAADVLAMACGGWHRSDIGLSGAEPEHLRAICKDVGKVPLPGEPTDAQIGVADTMLGGIVALVMITLLSGCVLLVRFLFFRGARRAKIQSGDIRYVDVIRYVDDDDR
jgi:hypothetical protein